MANNFYAFRVNPETDDDIIIMMDNAENKTEFIKACLRVAKAHILDCCGDECWDVSDDEEYIRSAMEV